MSKPTMAGADPEIIARRAAAEVLAHKQQMDHKKNLLLGVAVNAPIILDDALVVACAEDESFADAIANISIATPSGEDAEADTVSVYRAMADASLRKQLLRVHGRMSVEWAMQLTDVVNAEVEKAAAEEGKAALAATIPKDQLVS